MELLKDNSRAQINFYKSYYDIYKKLNTKQKIEFMDVLLALQFLELRVDEVEFKNSVLAIVWESIKHSVAKSIKGYLDALKGDDADYGVYSDYYIPNTPKGGKAKKSYTPARGNEENQETPKGGKADFLETPSNKDKGERIKDKGESLKEKNLKKENQKKDFSFTLKQKTKFANLSDEYQTKLKEKIERLMQEKNYTLSFEDFKNSCLANGYVYTDFSLAYQNWAKRDYSLDCSKEQKQSRIELSEQEAQEMLERVQKPSQFDTFGDLNIDALVQDYEKQNTKEDENEIKAEIEYHSRAI